MTANGARYATAQDHADRLNEALRLAVEIADEAARSDIESCGRQHGAIGHLWWFTQLPTESDTYELMAVARAVRYLELRGRLAHHPDQPHLVRFLKP